MKIITTNLTIRSGGNAEAVLGSGNAGRESREVRDFHGLELEAGVDLSFTLGEQETLSIEAEDNVLPRLETVVEDGVLRIRWRAGAVRTTRPVRLRLTARALDTLTVSGSGDVTTSGRGFAAPALDVTVRGSGTVKLAGRVECLGLRVSGSGDFEGGDLQAKAAKVKISGSGEATLWVQDTLEVKISGSGALRYHGSPKVVKSVRDEDSLRALGDKAD